MLTVKEYRPAIRGTSVVIEAHTTDKKMPIVEIPDAFRDLCNDRHMGLELIHLDRPELWGLPEEMTDAWLPVNTEGN